VSVLACLLTIWLNNLPSDYLKVESLVPVFVVPPPRTVVGLNVVLGGLLVCPIAEWIHIKTRKDLKNIPKDPIADNEITNHNGHFKMEIIMH
jgi:hypothetical protein